VNALVTEAQCCRDLPLRGAAEVKAANGMVVFGTGGFDVSLGGEHAFAGLSGLTEEVGVDRHGHIKIV
jgi:hypothetical protein